MPRKTPQTYGSAPDLNIREPETSAAYNALAGDFDRDQDSDGCDVTVTVPATHRYGEKLRFTVRVGGVTLKL